MGYSGKIAERILRPQADNSLESTTMTGNETLTAYSPHRIIRDPGGANRTITTWTPTSSDDVGRRHAITCAIAAEPSEQITVDATWTIMRGQTLEIEWSGSAWVRVAGRPCPTSGYPITRSTIADAGTVTDAQHRGLVLYQDASGGSVTMTTRTGTQLAAAFPDLGVGDAVSQFLASNHATNTSTIAGGTDVTLVGSGAVTQTGGQFLLVKTAATTFDLVRVG